MENAYTAFNPSLPTEIIGSPFTVTVDSDPATSTIQSFTTEHIAGNQYTLTIQSRDVNRDSLDSKFDDYTVQFTRSDSGGSQQLATTAIYQPTSGGLYKAQFTPTIAGQYTVTVHIKNAYTAFNPSLPTEIIGSPFTLTVDSDPVTSTIQSFTTEHIAGNQYTLTIQSRDVNRDSLDSKFDDYTVQFTRSDSGGSQQLATTAIYQPTSGGLYKAQFTPTIAGQYTVTVHIKNAYTAFNPSLPTEIIGSPFTVTVDSDPGKSTIETITTEHIAGELYTLTIQSRDFNKDRLDSTFDVYTVQFTRSDGGGSQQLTTTATYQPASGLYEVLLTPTIAGQYTMTLSIANAYTAAFPSIYANKIWSTYFVTVYPGLVDPYLCYSDVPLLSIPEQTANVAFKFKI